MFSCQRVGFIVVAIAETPTLLPRWHWDILLVVASTKIGLFCEKTYWLLLLFCLSVHFWHHPVCQIRLLCLIVIAFTCGS